MDNSEKARNSSARSFGNRLNRSAEETRHFFKWNSDWQRDQTISRIEPSPGNIYRDDYPLEERMAAEWSQVYGAPHSTADNLSKKDYD